MTETDRPAFAQALYVLAETFSEPISDLRAEGYFNALMDLSLPAVTEATLWALRACKFFPRPVELRELIEGSPDANADAAWSALVRAVQRVGYMGTPTFEDPAILQTVNDVWGSWRRLCQTLPGEGGELVGWIKQFKAAHRSRDARIPRDRLLDGVPTDIRGAVLDLAARKAMPGAK